MNDKVEALVLGISDQGENDLLLQVLSRDYGILSIVAKAAKKLTAHHHFSVLCLYEFIIDYKEGKTLFVVHNSRLLRSFYVDNDLLELSFRNIFMELSRKLSDIVDGEYYDKLLFCLDKFAEGDRYLPASLFMAFVLKKYGIEPLVDSCVVCGKKQVVSISKKKGGFLCDEHADGEDRLDVLTLKKYRLINKASFEHYDILKKTEFDFRDFCLLISFFEYNSDISLKSFSFYKTIV